MEYSLPIAVLLGLFIGHTSSQSASVNVSISSAVVKFGEHFNITVDFYPSTFAERLETLKCGYETGSSAFADFVEYSLFRNTFELITSGFPAAYVGRLTIPSSKKITIFNVRFADEGTNYHCELKHNLDAVANFLSSNKASLTTVYSLPAFEAKSLSTISDVIKGRNTTLSCSVSSRPTSLITWSYESGINAVQSSSSVANGYYTKAIGMITIINADLSLNGKTISCTGTPVYGSPIVKTTTLKVLYPHVIISVSSSVVKADESFNISVDFYPRTFADGLDTVKCGFETGSSVFSYFVDYSLHRNTFELISSGFPATYVGRITIPSPKMITVSNVKFADEGTKYHCELNHDLGAGAITLNSNKANLTTVYSLPVFGSNSMSMISDVIEGMNSTIYCRVTSRPASTITFSYESGINAVQSNSSSADGDYINTVGILTIIDADVSLNGKTVSCTGTPVYGSRISSKTILNVLRTTSKPVYTGFKSTTKTPKETTTTRTDIKDFDKAVPLDSSKTWIHLGYIIVIVILVFLVIFLILRDRRNKKKEVIPEPKVDSTLRRDANICSTEMHYMELANREKTREPTYATLTNSTYEEVQKPNILPILAT